MDVFDLQASVKIDTTDANQKLDALIAKAKELNNLLDRPHNINVNNGNGGNGGNPFSGGNGGGSGVNGYLPSGANGYLPSGGSTPFSPIIPVGIPSGGGTPAIPSGWSTPSLPAGSTPLLPSGGNTPLLGAGGGGADLGALIPGVGTVSGGAAAAGGGAEALLAGTTLSAGVTAGLIAGGLATVGGAVGYFASGMAADSAAKAADLESDVNIFQIETGYKTNPFKWNGIGAMLGGNSWKPAAQASPTYIDVPKQSATSELNRGFNGVIQRRKKVSEDNAIPVNAEPIVNGDAASDIAAQIGEVDVPVNLTVKYASYNMLRSFLTGSLVDSGTGDAFDASSVAGAVNKLSNKLDHMTIQVGKKTFGRTVVDNGGKSLQNYLGASQQSVAGGYGWR